MKRPVCLVLLLSVLLPAAYGQPKSWLLNETTHDEYPVHFGIALGLNTMDCAIEGNGELGMLAYGFSIQAVGSFRLNNDFDLRTVPGISFGDRNLKCNGDDLKMRISCIDIPLLLKYKSKRYSNVRPYLTAGGTMRYLLNKVAVDFDGEQAATGTGAGSTHLYDLELNRFEPYFDAGAGIDFYLPFFKFTMEFRGSWGVQNSVRHASERCGVESLKPSVYALVFYFE